MTVSVLGLDLELLQWKESLDKEDRHGCVRGAGVLLEGLSSLPDMKGEKDGKARVETLNTSAQHLFSHLCFHS